MVELCAVYIVAQVAARYQNLFINGDGRQYLNKELERNRINTEKVVIFSC